MSRSVAVLAGKGQASYGADVLDHLAADGAGFAGGQVTVVTVGQVDTDLGQKSILNLSMASRA